MNRPIRILSLLVLLIAGCGTAGEPGDGTNPPPVASAGSIPEDAGPFFVDSAEIVLMESGPVQVALQVIGSLPTPCHQPAWEVHDDGSTIAVNLASVAEPGVVCAQVLQPTQLSIPLGTFESGAREVTLNGDRVGNFEV